MPVELSTVTWADYQQPYPWGKADSSQELLTVCSFPTRSRPHELPLRAAGLTDWSCAGIWRQPLLLTVWELTACSSWPLAFTLFPLSLNVCQALAGMVMDVPSGDLDHWCFFVLTSDHCKDKFLWWRVRAGWNLLRALNSIHRLRLQMLGLQMDVSPCPASAFWIIGYRLQKPFCSY